MKLLFNFIFIYFILCYNINEIKNDFQLTNFNELFKYRGNILNNIWINKRNNHNNNKNNIESDHDYQKMYYYKEKLICYSLFEKTLEPVNITWPPPQTIPQELIDEYTIGGKMKLQHLYMYARQNDGEGYIWNRNTFDELRSGTMFCGIYNEGHCGNAVEKNIQFVRNKTGIVVGSQSPWAEAGLFNFGAKHITTIEYMKITSDYPNYSSLHPNEVAVKFLKKQWHFIDFAFSFSSIEHDGLGRYGDPLNPFSDLETVARIRCLLKPGGILFLGVPFAPDTIVYNAHRVYGKYRIALLLLGWDLIDMIREDCDVENPKLYGDYECQPILVLQKPYLKQIQ